MLNNLLYPFKVDFDMLSEKLTKLEVDCKLCYSYLRSVAKHDNNTTRLNKLVFFTQMVFLFTISIIESCNINTFCMLRSKI